jgi:hypothetical protein
LAAGRFARSARQGKLPQLQCGSAPEGTRTTAKSPKACPRHLEAHQPVEPHHDHAFRRDGNDPSLDQGDGLGNPTFEFIPY